MIQKRMKKVRRICLIPQNEDNQSRSACSRIRNKDLESIIVIESCRSSKFLNYAAARIQ